MMPELPSSPTVVVLALGVCGCGAEIGAPPAEPVAVIQALLIAGDSQQTAWVEWRAHADSSFGPEVRPVEPALVQILVILPDGSSVPFAPALGVPGRFDAAVTVDPGSRYRLTGTVAGVALAGETTVPDPLTVRVPAQDTVNGNSCVGSLLCQLPYRWFAAGAAAYLYVQSESDTSRLRDFGWTQDTVGVIQLLRGTGTEHLIVLALEEHAASFLTVTTPKSSVSGIFGLFGAATRAERWVAWQ